MVFEDVIFWVLAVVSVAAAIGVVTLKDVFRGALLLVLVFLAVAGFFVMMNAEFLAVVQVLIYAGAIAILIIFAIMLTRSKEYPSISVNAQWPLAALAGLGFFGLLTAAFLTNAVDLEERNRVAFTDLGRSLFTDWALPFEIASLILLVALVGAIVIARAEGRER